MTLLVLVAAAVTSAIGVIGGLGGGVLLVPVLVLAGLPVNQAAPLGLLTVAAGSLAASPQHLMERSVNHRLGVATESAATAGVILGALTSGLLPERPLIVILAVSVLAAGLIGGSRRLVRNPPQPDLGPEHVGERVGMLSGAYPSSRGVAPYRVRRVPLGLALMGLSGVVAGTTGASGGFIKTPVLAELMHVPTRVAAATTTFTIGITAAAAIIIFTIQGRLDLLAGSAAILGSLLGGQIGVRYQSRLVALTIRRTLSLMLVAVAIVLLAT